MKSAASLQLCKMYRALISQLEHEQFRLLLWLPVFLAIGIGFYFMIPDEPDDFAWLVTIIGGALIAWLIWRLSRQLLLALPIVLIALGFGAAQLEVQRLETPMLVSDLGFATITGIVADIEALPQGRRILLQNVVAKAKDKTVELAYVRLVDRKQAANIQIGQQVQWRAFLRAPGEPVMQGGFDFRRHAYFAGIGATGFLYSLPEDIRPQAATSGGFAALRLKVQKKVNSYLTGDVAAIAVALLTGSQNGISEQAMEEMRLAGLVHILSVSGLHIGLAAGILFFLIRALLAAIPPIALRYPVKKWAAGLSWFGALAYTLFVGAPVPAVRSLLMITLALLAIIFDRTALSLRVVALSAAGILLALPHSLLTPSFQLSYAAIAAIIALYELIEQRRRATSQPGYLMLGLKALGMIAVTSVAASLATAPLTHYHFQQLQGYGVLSNMLAIPLTSFCIMPAAIASLALMPLGLEQWPLTILGEGIEGLIAIAGTTAQLPGSGWQPAAMPFAALMAIVGGGLWLLIWQRRWRWAGLLPVVAGVILTLTAPQPDLLVSADGHFAAVKDGEGYVLFSDSDRRQDDGFVPDEWRQWLGLKAYKASDQSCTSGYCHVRHATLLRDPNLLPELCASSAIIIYGAGNLQDCGDRMFDRRWLRLNGATMMRDHEITTVREQVGRRPWSRYRDQ